MAFHVPGSPTSPTRNGPLISSRSPTRPRVCSPTPAYYGQLRSTVNYGLHRTRLANRNPPGPVNPRPKPASISTASLPPASADSNSPTRTKMESWQLLTAPSLSKLSYSGESPLLRDPLVWCLHSGPLQLGFCGVRLCNLHHPVGKGSNSQVIALI